MTAFYIKVDYVAVCDKFEKGLGVILKNAWQHIEVMQTTDLPAVINHISDVLDFCLHQPRFMEEILRGNDAYQRQELLVIQYLHDILRNVEDLREGR